MTLHLLRPIVTRDLRNQRWLLLVWIVLVIANVASRVIGPHLPIGSTENEATGAALTMLMFAHVIVAFIGIGLIVQTDLLVGTTAFWLTRPISRGTMLGAKLVSIGLIMMLPALAIEAMLMAAYGVSPVSLTLALLQQAWLMLPWLLLIALGASVTRTLVQHVALAVIAFVTLILWGLLTPYIWEGAKVAPVTVMMPQRTHDPSGVIIAGALISGCLLATLAFQYWRRQAAVAVLIAAVSLAAVIETSGMWWQVSLFGGEPKPPQGAWTSGPLVLRSGTPITWNTLRTAARIVTDNIDQSKVIAAPLTIEGLPANYTAEPVMTDATLRFVSGAVVPAWTDDVFGRVDRDNWPVVVSAPNDRLRAAGNGPAAYHAQFDIGLIRHDRLATVPITPGAGYNDGARRLIVASMRPLGGPVPRCLVRLDETSVELLTQRRRSPRLEVHARLADGTPLRTMTVDGSMSYGYGRPYDAMQAFHPFQIAFRAVEITAPRCDGLLLDIERVSYAGRLLRTIDLPEVNVNEVTATEPR